MRRKNTLPIESCRFRTRTSTGRVSTQVRSSTGFPLMMWTIRDPSLSCITSPHSPLAKVFLVHRWTWESSRTTTPWPMYPTPSPRPKLSRPHLRVDREARVLRYREKRKNRKFEKTIRYASRKAYAETRPRIKGRFAKRSELEVDSLISGDASYGVVPTF
ncbi:UNVERIFIED_CONTAM: Zinc finger protein CONSTANS-LIKE 5 [Sesamum angustifolium]|uniref:Zinc finger protein CONSTANS-LIKE 5 n=1 Tax=Sesamum angustifolium TaxID=2727405 RepID=A0AAW2M8A8_9LAMI